MLATMTGVEKLLKAGGNPSKIAKKLSEYGDECSRQNVEYWRKVNRVPGLWAQTVQKAFGIPLHELNPDIYPKPNGRA
jgi:hypothetical protein